LFDSVNSCLLSSLPSAGGLLSIYLLRWEIAGACPP
jgi:hypothetical protein